MRTYSHSAMKQFNNCPRQYNEMRNKKAWPREETEQTLYGTQLHEAMEFAVRDGVPLPKQFDFMQPVLDALLARPGEKFAEMELAVDRDLVPCPFKAPNVWMRGIADLVGINGNTAWVIDYKTGGNKYPDKDQLTLMALLLFAHYPDVKVVKSALLFVLKEDMVKHETRREAANRIWGIFREDVAKIEQCHDKNTWHPKSSGLCKKYCAVLSCEHNGRNV
jgi:hypothetical protein